MSATYVRGGQLVTMDGERRVILGEASYNF